jgi:hypothetical protein
MQVGVVWLSDSLAINVLHVQGVQSSSLTVKLQYSTNILEVQVSVVWFSDSLAINVPHLQEHVVRLSDS